LSIKVIFQGCFRHHGVSDEVFVPEKVEFYGMFSFMKAGLVYADIITTVSETYAKKFRPKSTVRGWKVC